VTRAAVLAGVIFFGACDRRAPIASCDDDLRGVYRADDAGGERWMVLDHRATLEAYPLFPDTAASPEPEIAPPIAPEIAPRLALEIAPRVIDLARPSGGAAGGSAASAQLDGTVRRRYLQRAARCDAQAPVRVTRCADDTLELVLTDPQPPLGFAPCTWPRAAASRVERWRRE
jgi:hypothetical protein